VEWATRERRKERKERKRKMEAGQLGIWPKRGFGILNPFYFSWFDSKSKWI
jgi:hypothetical protein